MTARPTRFATKPSNILAPTSQHVNQRFFSAGEQFVFDVPTMGDSITEGTVVEWLKNVGDYVESEEVFCVIETDKVSVDIRALDSGGIMVERFAEEGDTVDVGAPLVKFEKADPPPKSETPEPKEETKPVAKPEAPPAASAPEPAPTPAPTPAPAPAPAASTPSPSPTPAPSAGSREERRVKMTRMRMRIAERLGEAQSTAVLLTTFNEIDMSNLMNMRKKYKDQFEKVHGVKLGFMSAFVRAATAALQEVPAVNAFIDGNEIVYRDYCDVSIAVSSPRGLVVPVLRDTQNMSFADVEGTIAELGAKARNDSISLEEMTGGTFTVSVRMHEWEIAQVLALTFVLCLFVCLFVCFTFMI